MFDSRVASGARRAKDLVPAGACNGAHPSSRRSTTPLPHNSSSTSSTSDEEDEEY